MPFDAGSALAKYLIDSSQAEQAAQKIKAIWEGIGQSQRPGITATKAQSLEELKLAQALARTAEANARRAASTAKKAAEDAKAGIKTAQQAVQEQKLARETANTAAAEDRATKVALSLAAARDRAAAAAARKTGGGLGSVNGLPILPRTVESFGTQAIDQFKSGLLGIVGPAAIATAAIGGLTRTAQSFRDAFVFKAELDATNQAIVTNIGKVRDSGQVFAQAAEFANKYRLTQRETADILASSTDTLRTSTASVGDLEAALLRLQSRDVSKPVSEAARALRELQSGDVTSIKELFNVPAKEALRMRDEIVAGGDAVKVLNDYLNRAGVSMGVLENRSKGVAGALNEQKIAAENVAIAQANIASSSGGILFVQEQTRVYQGLANVLNGQVVQGLQGTANELVATIVKHEAHARAIAAGKTEAEAAAIAEDAYRAALAAAAAEASKSVGPDEAKARSLHLVADAAREAANELGRVADGKSNDGKRTIGPSANAGLLALAQGRQITAQEIAASQERYKALKRSELELAYTKAKTNIERMAILRQELALADSQIEKNGVLSRIEGLKNSTAKAHTGELGKQLNLQESIFDSLNKQKDAQLSLLELQIKDRQDTRKEQAELKAANAILNSSTASADLKARAQDRIDLINVNRQQRQQKILEDSATANATIRNGKLYQSIPNGPTGSPTSAASSAAVSSAPSSARAPVAASGGAGPTLQMVVDGRAIAEVVLPYTWSEMMRAVNSVKVTKGV
jgi:hypothetical protein